MAVRNVVLGRCNKPYDLTSVLSDSHGHSKHLIESPGWYSGASMQPSHLSVASAPQFAHCVRGAGAISSGKNTESVVEGDSNRLKSQISLSVAMQE